MVLKPGMTDEIDGTTFCNRGQPGAGIARNAVNLPAFQRSDQRILQGILCEGKISKLADQGSEDAPVFFAERFLDL